MKLLVSVMNEREALEAARGGAHIIDVKNPKEGSLGASFPRVIRRVREVTPKDIEISATIGDLPNLPGTASLAALGAAASGAEYVKAGLYGPKTLTEAMVLMKEVCRAVKDYNSALKVVAAGYADFREVGCISPLRLPEVARKAGADVVMVDVKMKGRGKLFDFLGDDELKGLIDKSHSYGLLTAMAGSLGVRDVRRVYELGADVIGVRGAVCDNMDRLKGGIQWRVVMGFVKEIDAYARR